uniref:Laccase n=1 Tax=Auricularia auricula-judae TaxID=29892 RepID=D3K4I1_AURAJ|nr:laccase [Auricularia auricula-judae]
MRLPVLLGALCAAGMASAALVEYDLVISQGNIKNDGQTKRSWLINGQSPGPAIVATKGDTVNVRVLNLGSENITIHWHGIEQFLTPWSGGVPGLTQFPIRPLATFTYNFKVTQTGVYWYHSHHHMQMVDGLQGPVFLKPDAQTVSSLTTLGLPEADQKKALHAELHPRFLSVFDNQHKSGEYVLSEWHKAGIEQLCLDDILINGKGQVVCPDLDAIASIIPPAVGKVTKRGCAFPDNANLQPYGGKPSEVDPDLWFNCVPTSTPLEVFQVSASEKFVAFNIVNSGTTWELRVSIDSHSFWVFTADGAYISPVKVNVISIPVGERFQILVPLDQSPGDYTIRVAAKAMPQLLSGYAVLSYKKSLLNIKLGGVTSAPPAKHPFIDYGGNVISGSGGVLFNAMAIQPFPAQAPPSGPADVTIRISLQRSDALTWTMNGVPLPTLPEQFTPLLIDPKGISNLDPALYTSFKNGSIVDIILETTVLGKGSHPAHPIHKHNTKAFFLGTGTGRFPAATVWEAFQRNTTGLNLVNPPLRDDFNTPPTKENTNWAALRFQSVNPMVTIMHCHIDPHLAGGMSFIMMEGLEALQPIPAYYKDFH